MNKLIDVIEHMNNKMNNNRIITYAYSKDGKFFKEYESQTSASKELEIGLSVICQAIQLGVKRKEFYFSTEKQDSFDKARSIQISKRSVYKYSVDGEFIEGFETQKEAELKHPYSNITKAIKLKSVCENDFMWSLEKLQNFNVPEVFQRIIALLPESPAYYPKDQLTDKPERFFVNEIIGVNQPGFAFINDLANITVFNRFFNVG